MPLIEILLDQNDELKTLSDEEGKDDFVPKDAAITGLFFKPPTSDSDSFTTPSYQIPSGEFIGR